jgi:hypothetical protein
MIEPAPVTTSWKGLPDAAQAWLKPVQSEVACLPPKSCSSKTIRNSST